MKWIQPNPDPRFRRIHWRWAWLAELVTDSFLWLALLRRGSCEFALWSNCINTQLKTCTAWGVDTKETGACMKDRIVSLHRFTPNGISVNLRRCRLWYISDSASGWWSLGSDGREMTLIERKSSRIYLHSIRYAGYTALGLLSLEHACGFGLHWTRLKEHVIQAFTCTVFFINTRLFTAMFSN